MTESEFLSLLDFELGLTVAPADLSRDVDDVTGWDSVLLLRLLSVLESRTGRRLPFAELIETRTLQGIRELAVRNG
jgi:acyl carrier protein